MLFSLFLHNQSVFEETTVEMQLHSYFVLSLLSHLLSSILSREFSFNNVNLCGSNVVQIFELFLFAIVKDNCLPTYLNNISSILKSSNKLTIGKLVAG